MTVDNEIQEHVLLYTGYKIPRDRDKSGFVNSWSRHLREELGFIIPQFELNCPFNLNSCRVIFF